MLGHTAAQIHGANRVEAVTLDDGRRVETDHVLIGIGVAPDLDWLAGCGLPTTGIPTDAGGRSELPGVYAAGDAAAFFDAFLGRHALSGHWESAGRQGAMVANAITGSRAAGALPYRASGATSTGRGSSTSATRSSPIA